MKKILFFGFLFGVVTAVVASCAQDMVDNVCRTVACLGGM